MFIKVTNYIGNTYSYLNVANIKSIEPTDYISARAIITLVGVESENTYYVLEPPEELIAQIQRHKKI